MTKDTHALAAMCYPYSPTAPLTYDGWTYTWEIGRQLAAVSGNGYNLSYKYNDQGIRTSKTVNGVTTNYHLVGDRVTYEDNGTDKIYYTYDAAGKLVSMNLNGAEYYYIRSGQGDITGLFDRTGTQVVSYTYDTWGKLISTTDTSGVSLGTKNPYRYRGYRYDTETGLYYLNSRYYNPNWGRFLNMDDPQVMKELIEASMNDPASSKDNLLRMANLFAYCANNPVNNSDPSGYWMPKWLKDMTKGAIHNIAKWLRDNDFSLIVGTLSFIFAPGLVGFASKVFSKMGQAKKFATTGHMGIMSIVSKGPAKRAFDSLAGKLRQLTAQIGFGVGIPAGLEAVLDPEGWWGGTPVGKAIDWAITEAEKWVCSQIDGW